MQYEKVCCDFTCFFNFGGQTLNSSLISNASNNSNKTYISKCVRPIFIDGGLYVECIAL